MTATPAQIAAVGFAALAVGKSFEALEQAGVTLSVAQQGELSGAVGKWLRTHYDNATVESAKAALGESFASEDAAEDEVAAAVEAAGSSLAVIFSQLEDAPAEAIDSATDALHKALEDAYGEESIAALWQQAPANE